MTASASSFTLYSMGSDVGVDNTFSEDRFAARVSYTVCFVWFVLYIDSCLRPFGSSGTSRTIPILSHSGVVQAFSTENAERCTRSSWSLSRYECPEEVVTDTVV